VNPESLLAVGVAVAAEEVVADSQAACLGPLSGPGPGCCGVHVVQGVVQQVLFSRHVIPAHQHC
jgi:hypothetical protein